MPSISFRNPSNITKLKFTSISTERLGGVIDASAFENLEELTCHGNDITGMTGFYNNPNMRIVLASDNKLSGSIPDLTSMTNLKRYWVHMNEHTGGFPNINGLSELGVINISDNNLTGTLPADLQSLQVPRLVRLIVYKNAFTGAIPDCAGMNILNYVQVSYNNLTDFTGGVEPSVSRFYAHNNNLTQTAVDNILQAFVDAGRSAPNYDMSEAIINVSGTNNSHPSSTGLANANILRSRGWSVIVSP